MRLKSRTAHPTGEWAGSVSAMTWAAIGASSGRLDHWFTVGCSRRIPEVGAYGARWMRGLVLTCLALCGCVLLTGNCT
jgi:hypothetical protein